MSFFETNSLFYSDNDASHIFSDKRNRNPNWTDTEIMRFLELLQEEDTMKDLMAQRNKQVFCFVAQRLCSEGYEKTWDQCRIKLKNLKSQYRYVKDRIPNIDDLDLEDDDIMRELTSKCQGRGISPSSIKHLRFLKRFLIRQSSAGGVDFRSNSTTPPAQNPESPVFRKILLTSKQPSHVIIPQKPGVKKPNFDDDLEIEDDSVSPPSTPVPSQSVKIISSADSVSFNMDPDPKRARLQDAISSSANGVNHINQDNIDMTTDGYKYIEKFNRDMMDQFLDFQKRSQASFIRWEQERVRQEHLAMERWRQEAREHERQLFGMFCTAMSQCNAALTTMLKSSSNPTSRKRSSSPFSDDLEESDPDTISQSKKTNLKNSSTQ